MANVKEESLISCLSYIGLRDLPKEWDKENVYILAVGLVSKSDGTFNYVALKKDKNGKDKIVKDFGNIASLCKIEKVYPYKYLDAAYVPTFKTRAKEERISWLAKFGENKDYSSMSVRELDKEILNISIQTALKE